MSPTRVLNLSLAGNVLLGAILLALLLRPATTSRTTAAPSSSSPPPAQVTGAVAPAAVPIAWEDSMGELRRRGVPADIIARLVVEKVARKWTPIETELERKYLHDEIDARGLAEFHDQRAREENAELRAALGDGFLAWDIEHTVGNMYLGGLVPSEDQKRPLYDLQKRHLGSLQALEVAKREGRLAEADYEAAHARETLDFKTQLAGLIGAERVDGLQAETPGGQLIADFARLGLDNVQMRDLAAVNATWSAARSEMARSLEQTATVDSAYAGDLQALDRARDEEYRRILGDERINAWLRATDDRHRLMKANAAAWKLDPPTIDSVYTAIRAYDLAVASREYQAQLAEQSGETVDWSKVQGDIALFSQDAERTLRARVGDETFARLREAEVISMRKPDLARSAPHKRPQL